MYSEKDLQALKAKGISISQADEQLNSFKNGFPVLQIEKPAIPGDGIRQLSVDELKTYSELFDQERSRLKIVKFVPASGAATRMFKSLFEFLNDKKNNKEVTEVLDKIHEFAFHQELSEVLKQEGIAVSNLKTIEDQVVTIDRILGNKGLNYGNLPKGLLKFHQYTADSRTAFEEHLAEGGLYASGKNHQVHLHFTVSPEHRKGFEQLLNQVQQHYEKKYNVTLHVEFSEQKPSTDTLAANENNEAFRDNQGNIIFRPGGHGALLENLNDTKGDIIFIKNIDNVVPDHLKAPTVQYKKSLAGLLISLQAKIFQLYGELHDHKNGSIEKTIDFIQQNLGYRLGNEFETLPETEKYLKLIGVLNRPIRVCGMVRNQGEPGGGPFWIRESNGDLSLQILESSQFDFKIPQHKEAFQHATHFNPVDLICSTRDKDGNPYNLLNFRDPLTGFISIKSKDGKELKALELPGLWNGSMANWNTIFVEEPIETFNPVKTVNDLLRPQHRG